MRTVSSEPGRSAAHDAVELASDPLDGRPRPLVAHVGLQPDPVDPPHLEGVRQHQQLGLRVDRSPLRRTCQPGETDVDDVGHAVALMARPGRPLPEEDLAEPRGTHDAVAAVGPRSLVDRGEGHVRPRRRLGQRVADVVGHLLQPVGRVGPSVVAAILGRCLDERGDVRLAQRFESDVVPLERERAQACAAGTPASFGAAGPLSVAGRRPRLARPARRGGDDEVALPHERRTRTPRRRTRRRPRCPSGD